MSQQAIADVRTAIRNAVGSGRRILDVGYASPELIADLQAQGCSGTRIDSSEQSATTGGWDSAMTVDLDFESLQEKLGDCHFDFILVGAILEELHSPVRFLNDIHALCERDGATLIIHLRNSAHGAIRLSELAGTIEYQAYSLLEGRKLRFFTRDEIRHILARTGFRDSMLATVEVPLFTDTPSLPPVRECDFSSKLVSQIRGDEDVDVTDFVVAAEPLALPDAFEQLQNAYRHLAVRAQTAEAAINDSNRQLALSYDECMQQLGRQYALAAAEAQTLEMTRRMLESTDVELKRTQAAYAESQTAHGALESRVAGLVEENDRLTKQCLTLEQLRYDQFTRAEALEHDLRSARESATTDSLEHEAQILQLAEAREAARRAHAAARAELAAIKNSRSWRITSPLRAVTRALRPEK